MKGESRKPSKEIGSETTNPKEASVQQPQNNKILKKEEQEEKTRGKLKRRRRGEGDP